MGLKLIEDHFVVSAFGGEPVNPNTIHKQFLYETMLAGMKRIRFHDLRHTHATIMLEIGENSKVVSEKLGHSKVSITLDKFTHLLRIYRTPLQKTFKKLQEKRARTNKSGHLTKKAMENPIA